MIKNNAVLLLSCCDQKGIVASISNFIFKYNGNIINSDQHSDSITNTFFMRIEWELENFKLKRNEIEKIFKNEVGAKFDIKFSLNFTDEKKNIAIFVSKYDHCLIDILLRDSVGEINGNIKLIISNHEDLKDLADSKNIAFYYLPITSENKLEQEEKQIEILQKNGIKVVVLARYMQILSSGFVEKYPNKIINIHHSFLPAFVGAKPYKQAFDRGVKLIGATSHYVTAKLDDGPIIEQDVIRISHKDTEEELIKKGRDMEKVVLFKALKLHLENKILTYGKKTVVFG